MVSYVDGVGRLIKTSNRLTERKAVFLSEAIP